MVEELRLPLIDGRVEAGFSGFPSPADDFIERSLDLNEQLVANPISTFFMRASGHSIVSEGIHDGDLLIVDRSITPTLGSIVVAVINGELTVKRLDNQESKIVVWGVVTWSVHRLKTTCTR
ncbi:MAG: translesion error-prone DNA polymerase V autoproteolytic subunit [Phycisphaerales bacterium]|nr:translesion error-prone DNA polymerase V autoproteolytic subunit [Planctomycetota bacterium]MBL6997830.1 translesion error-prone DNA polymerase V autoproteolytic subunit [Phycisphaerales bacterium]